MKCIQGNIHIFKDFTETNLFELRVAAIKTLKIL